jgi:hypothetical protein
VTGGKFIWVCPPIVFDLDGDGVEYRYITSGVVTDVDNDGRSERRAWIGPDDGLLVFDANGDGIGQHGEYVLTSFVEGAETDLDALKAFDSNRDGRFDAADAYFASFKVGRDLNQNGVFEANEMQSLASLGIVAINLVTGVQSFATPENPYESGADVIIFNTGQFVRADGSTGLFADVGFGKPSTRPWSTPTALRPS